MTTLTTQQGRQIELISQHDLRDPRTVGAYVRAYCHIHGSDHQRSLSIHRATGWGHCFNASCQATVLVVEWNSAAAARLTHCPWLEIRGEPMPASPSSPPPPPLARQLVLLYPPRETTKWQQDELALLQSLGRSLQRALTHSPRARAYLHARGIPLGIAMRAGVGYLSHDLLARLDKQERHTIDRWADRMVFPLVSPLGTGFIGRSLYGWQLGMDEKSHKDLLEQAAGPKRWIKTNPAGWFSSAFDCLAEQLILVEGGFDRLALLSAGFAPEAVVALVGTAAQPEWLPGQVKSVVLALDGDRGGQEATERLAQQFSQAGVRAIACSLQEDRWGKDWNECWRLLGARGLQPLVAVSGTLPCRVRSA